MGLHEFSVIRLVQVLNEDGTSVVYHNPENRSSGMVVVQDGRQVVHTVNGGPDFTEIFTLVFTSMTVSLLTKQGPAIIVEMLNPEDYYDFPTSPPHRVIRI